MTKEIDDILKRIQKTTDLIQRKDGQKLDLTKERIFVKGPFLHQNTETMSEEESAQFEMDNKELFNFLRNLNDQIQDIF